MLNLEQTTITDRLKRIAATRLKLSAKNLIADSGQNMSGKASRIKSTQAQFAIKEQSRFRAFFLIFVTEKRDVAMHILIILPYRVFEFKKSALVVNADELFIFALKVGKGRAQRSAFKMTARRLRRQRI